MYGFACAGILGTTELGAQSVLLQLDSIWFQVCNIHISVSKTFNFHTFYCVPSEVLPLNIDWKTQRVESTTRANVVGSVTLSLSHISLITVHV